MPLVEKKMCLGLCRTSSQTIGHSTTTSRNSSSAPSYQYKNELSCAGSANNAQSSHEAPLMRSCKTRARDRQKPPKQCDDHADAQQNRLCLRAERLKFTSFAPGTGAPTSGGACAGSRRAGCAAGSPTTLAKDAWQARPTFLFEPLCPRGSNSIAQLLLGGL